jgi:hypothetical protein
MTYEFAYLLAKEILFVYGITLLLTTGTIFKPIRQWIILRTPHLYNPLDMNFSSQEITEDSVHLVECRMCMGVWITFCACLYGHNLDYYWVVFGLSYFLATQER